MCDEEKWVRVGRNTFRLDLATRFRDEVDERGATTGDLRVYLGCVDEFTVEKGEGADVLRRHITQELRPRVLGPETPQYAGEEALGDEPGPDAAG